MPTIGELLESRQRALFVNREEELRRFESWLCGDSPLLAVTGPGGVGKSALLRACADRLDAMQRRVVLVDGRTIEPSPEGLSHAIVGDPRADVAEYLNATNATLMLDTFEDLAPVTTHLQRDVLVNLDESIRVVLAGRRRLTGPWLEWAPVIEHIDLDVLPPDAALTYLRRRGVAAEPSQKIVDISGGHPLALALAADMATQLGIEPFSSAPEWRIAVQQLVAELLRDVRDPTMRALIEAAAAVRQFSEEMLGAMVGDGLDVRHGYTELSRLSAVRPGRDGLLLHDDIRRLLVEAMERTRPDRLRELRRRARAFIRDRVSHGLAPRDEWLMVEYLYLLEDSAIQGGYFPPETWGAWTEPLRLEDIERLMEIHSQWVAALRLTPFRPPPEEADPEIARALLSVSECDVLRDPAGQPVAFAYLAPINARTLSLLPAGGPVKTLVARALELQAADALSRSDASTDVFYMSTIVIGPTEHFQEAVAILGRGGMRFMLRNILVLGCTGEPIYGGAMERTGFTKLPSVGRAATGDVPVHGYFLDLRSIDVELYVDAIGTGRPIPRPLTAGEAETEVRRALTHWRDDGALSRSALVDRAMLRQVDRPASPADSVRELVLEALRSARERASPRDAAALHAVEAGYLRKAESHERVAEQLAESRTTYFRLLRRGVSLIARELS